MTRPANRLRTCGFWRQVILNLGALLGAFCILATVGATVFGITPLVFRSGSMAPAIPAGALALSHTVPADRVHVGDVVSVLSRDGVRVTHRVAGIRVDGSTASLTLKGDANQTSDLQQYRVSSVKRVLFSVPRLGYLVAAASTPEGVFLGVAFVVLVLFLGFGGPRRDGEHAPGEGGRRTSLRGRGGLLLAAGAALTAGAIAVPLVPTMAYFTATATMTTSITAATTFPPPPTPTNFSCEAGGGGHSGGHSGNGNYTLSWSWTGTNPDSFQVTYPGNQGTSTTNPAGGARSVTVSPGSSSGTFTIVAVLNDLYSSPASISFGSYRDACS